MTEKLGSAPHGGVLINRVVPSEARGEAQARAARLPVVNLNARAASDLLLLATGAFSPLEGFMGHDAARSAAENLTLPDGLLWPLPVLLQLEASQAAAFSPGSQVALAYRGALLGALEVQERLAEKGSHRLSLPDLVIAATAEHHDATVLHFDRDYDRIAEITGQATQWVVARGTVA